QYNKVNTEGVTYRLNGKTITEKHFDFKNTIIKELKAQVDSVNAPGAKNWGAIDKQWREGVGGAQKLLPMHVVYEYCSDEPFYPVPQFTAQPNSSKQFFNWDTDKDENWFSVDSRLAVDFAIYKGGGLPWFSRPGSRRKAAPQAPYVDLVALKALCEVRTKDFIDLKSQLEERASLDNHYQIVPM
ncbi:TPA: F-box protein, partial [Legionella pneumophila]